MNALIPLLESLSSGILEGQNMKDTIASGYLKIDNNRRNVSTRMRHTRTIKARYLHSTICRSIDNMGTDTKTSPNCMTVTLEHRSTNTKHQIPINIKILILNTVNCRNLTNTKSCVPYAWKKIPFCSLKHVNLWTNLWKCLVENISECR